VVALCAHQVHFWAQVGRAGRDGRRARCIVYYAASDVSRARGCLSVALPIEGALPRIASDLAAVQTFCSTRGCRRAILFAHLNGDESVDSAPQYCNACDNCLEVSTGQQSKTTSALDHNQHPLPPQTSGNIDDQVSRSLERRAVRKQKACAARHRREQLRHAVHQSQL
jgi:superfamily II DNA helicase RecQ